MYDTISMIASLDVKEVFVSELMFILLKREPRPIRRKFNRQWKNVTTIILFSSLQEVEKILKSNKWNFSWDDNNNLRYWYIHSPVRPHPVTGEKMWFNQVTSYNASYFRDLPLYKNINMPDDHYPFHSYYGDGSVIQPAVLQHIRAAMWSCALGFRWRTNDVVVIDNLQVLHGRMGWTGERTLVTTLIDEWWKVPLMGDAKNMQVQSGI